MQKVRYRPVKCIRELWSTVQLPAFSPVTLPARCQPWPFVNHHVTVGFSQRTAGAMPRGLSLLELAGMDSTDLSLIVMAGLLSACAANPNPGGPAVPGVSQYTAQSAYAPIKPGQGEPAQRFLESGAIPTGWWRVFHVPPLNNLVKDALSGNLSVNVAQARLAEAQQAVVAARGGYYPTVDLGASVARQKGPAFALALLPPTVRTLPTFNLYSFGSTVRFSPDVFGETRRGVEQQMALAKAQRDQLAAVQLIISGDVVADALNIASLRQQMIVIKAMVRDDRQNLSLVQARFQAGKVGRDELLAAELQLVNDRARLPALKQQQSHADDALAVLVGQPPAAWTTPPFLLRDFVLPRDLPLSLPSALVRQRPDILAAQAELRASSAAVGVATARMYPHFTLSGSLDTAALTATSLFEQPSVIWTLAGGLTAPIFHGGALEARKKQAIAGFHASLAVYRQTVLQAFSQVADILWALRHDAELVTADRQALQLARTALKIRRLRYSAGTSGLLPLLDAQRSLQVARLAYIQSKLHRYLDSAQLFVAMGGGEQSELAGPATSPSADASSPAVTQRHGQ